MEGDCLDQQVSAGAPPQHQPIPLQLASAAQSHLSTKKDVVKPKNRLQESKTHCQKLPKGGKERKEGALGASTPPQKTRHPKTCVNDTQVSGTKPTK